MALKLKRGPRWKWRCLDCRFFARHKELDVYLCLKTQAVFATKANDWLSETTVNLEDKIDEVSRLIRNNRHKYIKVCYDLGLIDKLDIVRATHKEKVE